MRKAPWHTGLLQNVGFGGEGVFGCRGGFGGEGVFGCRGLGFSWVFGGRVSSSGFRGLRGSAARL